MALGLFAISFTACAQTDNAISKRHISAVKTDHPPVIDGDLSDTAWKSAAVAEKFVDAQNGTPVADQTTAYLLYDDKYIYVGFDCRDSHPEAIVGRETVRDTKFQQNQNGNNLNNEDNVEIDIDPFLSHQGNDLSQFSVNALGTRSASLAGGRGAKAEWKGDWDAAVKRTDTGWTCEMRIPWASLNYPSGKETVTMGIDFQRFQDRTKVWSYWSDVTTQNFLDQEGIWDQVRVPSSGFKPRVSILPYLLSGIQDGDTSSKVGVDARYTVTPQLTAVASYNPDFSTVEGAIQSIQFSHTAHSIQDRRPFFLEGGNYFYDQTNINDIGLYFYSIQVPRFDLGAKLYGKVTPADTVGLLDTDSFSGRNDFVGRWEHTFSPTSSGGAMVVQTDSPAGHNAVGVIDDHQRWGKLAFETVDANSTGPGAGGGSNVFSTYYADKYLTSMVQFSGVSNNFLTPDGYIPYTGYRGFTGVEDWSAAWRQGPLRSTEATLVWLNWDQTDGSHYFSGVQGAYYVETRSDWHAELDYVDMSFLGTRDHTIGANIVTGATNRFHQFGLQFTTGELGSVNATSFGPVMTVRMLKKLDVSYNGYILNREGVIQQHVLTLNYELSPTRSFGGRVVSQNADTNAYFFYHNSGGKGTEFYLILGDPNAPRTVRSIQAKWVFAFG
ncbi:MAG: carbohydrate binding family 9 domain-containing protein [Fimbriimonas sp.]|nr:carbohydrate binding family 9 domain-containing protein [Fimbriimonas sp.]